MPTVSDWRATDRRALIVGLGALVAVAGCTGNGSQTTTILVRADTGAEPREATVDPGTEVTWRNEIMGPGQHETIVSTRLHEDAVSWEFEGELETYGDEVSHTFADPGIYTYAGARRGEDCICGAILVGDVELTDSLPCYPDLDDQGC